MPKKGSKQKLHQQKQKQEERRRKFEDKQHQQKANAHSVAESDSECVHLKQASVYQLEKFFSRGVALSCQVR